ncbi:Serine/threonine-protein phosphatase 6 regulatory ankyrin repeat subunit C [Lasiodiplodia hormozganensis]|uniref:Serine/threonine-protein phosphatase 6 regulatory ankyrin repeat subunit C n=1 Tax=Lasiodiplodia hormozganensis TaxID=869390 RepID=A0AA39Z4X6_9PEZI|nr:Serine/threonine-protein phosphatase 6 regulatory ankyrin repeat subunit C [Lasiodiplodia hormozganensis]
MVDFNFTPYIYEPLPTPTSIRLIKIIQGGDVGLPTLCGHRLIRCEIQTVDLASNPEYSALSYTWDSPEPEWAKRKIDLSADGYGATSKWPIAVSGRLCYVRKNLYQALDQLALQYSVDRPDPDNFYKTDLIYYAEWGFLDCVVDMIQRGASVGARDYFGETSLHYAAENGHYEIVKELVRAGADMAVYDTNGRMPLHCAVHRKRGQWKKVVQFLEDPNFRRKELLQERGPDKGAARNEEKWEYDKTALHIMAELGRVDAVRALLKRKASVESKDMFGETPLHYAAENGEYKIVELLVRAGADINATDDEQRIPVTCALQAKRKEWEETVKFLQDPEFRQSVLMCPERDNNRKGPEEFIWIDALCINQDDLEERSAQVKIMPQVYGKAQSVLVWLGNMKNFSDRSGGNYDEFKSLTVAMKRMNSEAGDVESLKRKWRSSLRAFTRGDEKMPEDGIFSREEIAQITHWLTRSWFTRAWVVQELALAKKIKMFAAEFEFSWSEVLQFLCLLFHVGYFDPASFWRMDDGTKTEDCVGGDGSEAWKLAVIRLRTANNPEEWALLEPIYKQTWIGAPHVRQGDRFPLPLLLAETWNFGTKDPRDKVFSLLSLATPLPDSKQVKIDYSVPVSDLYTDVAYLFLDGSDNSSIYTTGTGAAGILEPLEGLSYVQDPYVGPLARNPNLPSWVPDFSTPLLTARIWSRRFQAATALSPSFGEGESKSILRVSGLEIDEVKKPEREWGDFDFLESDVHLLFYFCCEACLEYDNTGNQEPFLVALLRTLTVDGLWDTENEGVQAEAINSFRTFLCKWLQWHYACLYGGEDACYGPYTYSEEKIQSLTEAPDFYEKFLATFEGEESANEDLMVSLKAMRTRDRANCLPTDDELKAAQITDWCEFHGPDCTSETEDRKMFFSVMNTFYRKRSLFRTTSGRIGLGPQTMEPGDKIILIAGARTPYVVREISEETDDESEDEDASEDEEEEEDGEAEGEEDFEIVRSDDSEDEENEDPEESEDGRTPRFQHIGEVYLHGVMYGEAVAEGGRNFKTLELI